MSSSLPSLQELEEWNVVKERLFLFQVAINWTICKGALPIPGAKNARQVKEAAGALGWRLTADEVCSGTHGTPVFSFKF